VKVRNAYRHSTDKELIIAAEGYAHWAVCVLRQEAQLNVGNVLPIGSISKGTVVCNLESKPGDRGKLARSSGNYVTVIAHITDENMTRVKLPSKHPQDRASEGRLT
jgi:large subunit ribosomal protein L8e